MAFTLAAILFLVAGVVAAILGFTTIMGVSFATAKLFAALFIGLSAFFLIFAILASVKRAMDGDPNPKQKKTRHTTLSGLH